LTYYKSLTIGGYWLVSYNFDCEVSQYLGLGEGFMSWQMIIA